MEKDIKKLVKNINVSKYKIEINFIGGGNLSIVGTNEEQVKTFPLFKGDYIMGYETYINKIAIGSNSMYIFHTSGISVITGITQEKEKGVSPASVGVYMNDTYLEGFDTPYQKWKEGI